VERSVTMKRSMIGFVVLVAISGYLYITGFMQSVVLTSPAAVPLALAVLTLLVGYWFEWPTAQNAKNPPLSASDLQLVVAVIGGALASHWLNVTLGLGAVLGAGLVTVLAALIMPAFGAAITCGSFCGMVSMKVLPGVPYLILASAIAGIVFVLAKETMNGLGGKLGAMAAAGCTIAALIAGNKMLTASVPDWSVGKYVVPVAVVSAEAAYIVSTRFKHGPIMGSGIVSVVGGLILPALFPEVGATLAAACACGSYAGMSTRARIPNEWFMALAGIVAGLVLVWGAPSLGGIGGRLGTTALGGVIAIWSCIRIYERFSTKQGNRSPAGSART
jgi:hypothetical protein